MSRRYEMSSRAAAVQRTREAILDAATELFTPAWFDQVTLADIAKRAGVSQQTVTNHFGSKIDLYRTGLSERFVPMLVDLRGKVEAGDVDAVVAAILRDYERTGDGTWRTVALADREPDLADIADDGRRWHRAWVEQAFEPQLSSRRGARRERALTLLATALDVATWKRLRRDEGLDAEQTADHLRVLVEGILAAA